ncbi:MAG: DNA polymerase II, partial [Moraxellaceae bacterium]
MVNAFLLTRQWRDTREGIVLDFWWATEQGARWTQITKQEMVFFVLREDAVRIANKLVNLRAWRMAEVDLKTFRNLPVNALYFKHHRTARDAIDLLAQAGIPYWEADIKPHERYLMERFVTAGAIIESAGLLNDLKHTPVIQHYASNPKPIFNPKL